MTGAAARGLRFYTVGAGGIAVQFAALALLKSGFGLHYLAATALAVEAAVLHNFFWHQRWTWADRPHLTQRVLWLRLLRFNLTTGLLSIASNLGVMKALAGLLGLHYLTANAIAIAAAAVLNYLVADRFVWNAHPNGR